MDLSIANYSGQPLVILTSDLYFDKKFISGNMPNINDLLSKAANQGWLSSLEGTVYADSIDMIVSSIRQSLNPQIVFQDFILAGDIAFLRNIFVPPKYIYCIGISTRDHKLVLTFNVFNTEVAINKYISAEDLITAVKIYIGYNDGIFAGKNTGLFTGKNTGLFAGKSTFYCDNITPDGQPVCQKPLPASARFINDAYESRHNPKIMDIKTYSSDGIPFEQSMISSIDVTSKTIMRNQPMGNPIPPVGLDGQTYTAHVFLDNNDSSTFAKSIDEVKQTFTLAEKPDSWMPLAVLFFVLLIVAIVIGGVLYVLKSKGAINVYGSSPQAEPLESILI